jgi:predicted amidohydrolase
MMNRRSFVAAGMALAGRSALGAAGVKAEDATESGEEKVGVRVGMAQILVRTSAVDENLGRAEAAIEKAKALGCDIVVLPECLDLGWTNPESRRLAAPIPGPPSERLSAAARRNAIHVVAGLHERSGERLFNASVLFDDGGALVLKHHKINELDIAWDLYMRGHSLSVANTRFGPIAISICADNSPASVSLGHAAGHMGARMILSPCAWAVLPDYDNQKEPYGWDVWDVSYPDIARQHRMTVIGVSNVGPMEAGPWQGRLCIGSSLAVGPFGTNLARGPYGVAAEALVTVDVPAEPAVSAVPPAAAGDRTDGLGAATRSGQVRDISS